MTVREAIFFLLDRRYGTQGTWAFHNYPLPEHSERQLRLQPGRPGAAQHFVGLPVHGTITSRFGMRLHPILHRRLLHRGVDIAASMGSPVWATNGGTVSFVGVRGGYGLAVIVDASDGSQELYAHLSAASVRKGARIHAGEVLGTVGSSGLSTGPHVHYEVREGGRAVDPLG